MKQQTEQAQLGKIGAVGVLLEDQGLLGFCQVPARL